MADQSNPAALEVLRVGISIVLFWIYVLEEGYKISLLIFCFMDLCLGGGLRGVHILGLGMLDIGSA